MKNSIQLIARIGMICFALCITGNLYAHVRPSHKHKYYYYPKHNVYYDPAGSTYYVWERNHWKPIYYYHPVHQPAFIYPGAPRVELWISSAHPYYYNAEHRRTYYAQRIPAPAPKPRIHAERRPKANVSFELTIQPVERHSERVVIVHDHGKKQHPHHRGHRHHPGRGHGHGHGHKHH